MPAWGEPPAAEARALGATCGGVRVWSLYVPNGRTLEDPHLLYKLDWLGRLRDAGRQWLADDPQAQIALVGRLERRPAGRGRLEHGSLRRQHPRVAGRAGGVPRGRRRRATRTSSAPYTPGEFTYWDYKQLRFRAPGGHADRLRARLAGARRAGRRARRSTAQERKGKGASDHAPVVVELD